MLLALRHKPLNLQRSKQIVRYTGILFVVVESYRPPFGFVLNHMALGASDRAATMSGQPSPSKSAKAKPYTVPLPSFQGISWNVRPCPVLKYTEPGFST